MGKILNISIGKVNQKARIVEVEAYLGIEDPACHSFKNKRTERTSTMYLSGGHSYIYLIYGMHHCLNVVTRPANHPEAVLIRALEPLSESPTPRLKKNLTTNGPGKLCKHFQITKALNGSSLWLRNSPLTLTEDDFLVRAEDIQSRPRIGVDYAGEAASWPLRFYLKNNFYVSKP